MRRKTNEEFKKEIAELLGNEYTVIGNYQTSNTPITFRHNKCGHYFSIAPKRVLSDGCRCPYCSKYDGIRLVRLKRDLFKAKLDEYDIVSVSKDGTLRIRHNDCGYIFRRGANLDFHTIKCPHCTKNS